MKYIYFFILLLCPSLCFADTEELSWNRYTSDNFVVVSIKNEQGKWLAENLDKIKKMSLTRWGFKDFKFSKECRIFCVPNKKLLKELFDIEESKFEIIKKNDEFQMTTIWIVLDDSDPLKVLPKYITKACFAELEHQQKFSLGEWFKQGASDLNCSTTEIKHKLSLISADEKLSSKDIFAKDKESLKAQSKEDLDIFEKESLLMCLFLRKEFGESKLQGFLRLSSKNDKEDVFKMIYQFRSFSSFDKSYFRYKEDLKKELNKGHVPNSYLTISKNSFTIN